MKCEEMPLARRLFYGVLAREGMRVSEALGLTWNDADLVAGVVRLDSNKTDDPRTWALGPDVVIALNRWRKLHKLEARLFPFAELGDHGNFAQHLRDGLQAAGVARAELFTPSPIGCYSARTISAARSSRWRSPSAAPRRG